ncbi:hypothetical protein D3C87_1606310 [compost metagenome]
MNVVHFGFGTPSVLRLGQRHDIGECVTLGQDPHEGCQVIELHLARAKEVIDPGQICLGTPRFYWRLSQGFSSSAYDEVSAVNPVGQKLPVQVNGLLSDLGWHGWASHHTGFVAVVEEMRYRVAILVGHRLTKRVAHFFRLVSRIPVEGVNRAPCGDLE